MAAKTSEMMIKKKPHLRTLIGGSILFDGSGLRFVLVIMESISRSIYEVMTLHPALATIAVTSPGNHMDVVKGILFWREERIIAPKEVKTSSETNLGFAISMFLIFIHHQISTQAPQYIEVV